MANTDFITFAETIARSSDSLGLLPVIEKELLHYEILRIMEDEGFLEKLTFQGGTCLRLCYGASRYSEDLDFAGGRDFDFLSISKLKDAIEKSLSRRYEMEVVVSDKPEKVDDSGVAVKRWQIKVTTALERPDIPLQRISIEVASVDAHARRLRPLILNYEQLPASYADILLATETLEEICADKLKAFLTAPYVRHRDLWDMRWIARRPKFDRDQLPALFEMKLDDYHQRDAIRAAAGRIDDIPSIVDSSEFSQQMKRFLPSSIQNETIGRPGFLENIAEEVTALYDLVMP